MLIQEVNLLGFDDPPGGLRFRSRRDASVLIVGPDGKLVLDSEVAELVLRGECQRLCLMAPEGSA